MTTPAAVHFSKREIGAANPKLFARALCGTEDLVQGLCRFRTLPTDDGQNLRVSSDTRVSFNSSGDVLVSARSRDTKIYLWDWVAARVQHTAESGHWHGIVQVKFLEDGTIVTSGSDREVRRIQIQEARPVNELLASDTSLHELAIAPGVPGVFYGGGPDGLFRCDVRTPGLQRLLERRLSVSRIAVNPREPYHIALTGRCLGEDAKYVKVYDIRRQGSINFEDPVYSVIPRRLISHRKRTIRIDGLTFSQQGELLVSYYHDDIHLFASADGAPIHEYKGHNSKPYNCVSFFGPNSEYVISTSGSTGLCIWKKETERLIVARSADFEVDYIESHPHDMVFAGCCCFRSKGVKIWHLDSIERASEAAAEAAAEEVAAQAAPLF